jgi:predicted secreted protein
MFQMNNAFDSVRLVKDETGNFTVCIDDPPALDAATAQFASMVTESNGGGKHRLKHVTLCASLVLQLDLQVFFYVLSSSSGDASTVGLNTIARHFWEHDPPVRLFDSIQAQRAGFGNYLANSLWRVPLSIGVKLTKRTGPIFLVSNLLRQVSFNAAKHGAAQAAVPLQFRIPDALLTKIYVTANFDIQRRHEVTRIVIFVVYVLLALPETSVAEVKFGNLVIVPYLADFQQFGAAIRQGPGFTPAIAVEMFMMVVGLRNNAPAITAAMGARKLHPCTSHVFQEILSAGAAANDDVSNLHLPLLEAATATNPVVVPVAAVAINPVPVPVAADAISPAAAINPVPVPVAADAISPAAAAINPVPVPVAADAAAAINPVPVPVAANAINPAAAATNPVVINPVAINPVPVPVAADAAAATNPVVINPVAADAINPAAAAINPVPVPVVAAATNPVVINPVVGALSDTFAALFNPAGKPVTSLPAATTALERFVHHHGLSYGNPVTPEQLDASFAERHSFVHKAPKKELAPHLDNYLPVDDATRKWTSKMDNLDSETPLLDEQQQPFAVALQEAIDNIPANDPKDNTTQGAQQALFREQFLKRFIVTGGTNLAADIPRPQVEGAVAAEATYKKAIDRLSALARTLGVTHKSRKRCISALNGEFKTEERERLKKAKAAQKAADQASRQASRAATNTAARVKKAKGPKATVKLLPSSTVKAKRSIFGIGDADAEDYYYGIVAAVNYNKRPPVAVVDWEDEARMTARIRDLKLVTMEEFLRCSSGDCKRKADGEESEGHGDDGSDGEDSD